LYFRYILLWRGDLIHGGGFDNDRKNGAMRLHLYIPMTQGSIRSVQGDVTNKVDRDDPIIQKLDLNADFSTGNGLEVKVWKHCRAT
jgi:hypothetical protein